MIEYIILFAVVLAVNLMPAFGPPTWAILVLYGLNSNVPIAAAVLVAALAAALGRYLLARSFNLLGNRIPLRMRLNLAAAKEALERRKRTKFLALGLFALSPLPSAQLFEAAGLTGVRLLPFTAAFFAGRIVSYSIYVLGARELKARSIGSAFEETLRSPLGIGAQLLMIAGLIALVKIDWRRLLERKTENDGRVRNSVGVSQPKQRD